MKITIPELSLVARSAATGSAGIEGTIGWANGRPSMGSIYPFRVNLLLSIRRER